MTKISVKTDATIADAGTIRVGGGVGVKLPAPPAAIRDGGQVRFGAGVGVQPQAR